MSAAKRFFGTRRGGGCSPRSQFKGTHQTRRLRAVRTAKAGRASRGVTVSFAEGEKAARGSDRIETHQGSSLALEHRMAAVRLRSDVPHFTRGEAERHVAERRSHPLMERLTRGLANPSPRSRPVEPDAARYPACTCFQSSFAGSRYVASSVTLERRGTLGISEKTVGSTQYCPDAGVEMDAVLSSTNQLGKHHCLRAGSYGSQVCRLVRTRPYPGRLRALLPSGVIWSRRRS